MKITFEYTSNDERQKSSQGRSWLDSFLFTLLCEHRESKSRCEIKRRRGKTFVCFFPQLCQRRSILIAILIAILLVALPNSTFAEIYSAASFRPLPIGAEVCRWEVPGAFVGAQEMPLRRLADADRSADRLWLHLLQHPVDDRERLAERRWIEWRKKERKTKRKKGNYE